MDDYDDHDLRCIQALVPELRAIEAQANDIHAVRICVTLKNDWELRYEDGEARLRFPEGGLVALETIEQAAANIDEVLGPLDPDWPEE